MLTAEPTASGEAFGIEHIDSLYRYAIVLTGSPVEAEDLVRRRMSALWKHSIDCRKTAT
jgi:DNA-directed RNA polymerase specialized sigma24 family protein